MDHLNKKGRIFLVGIGGIGMSGIAEILHNLGYEVTGSDQKEGSNVIRLKKLGIKIKIGHNASNIKGSSLIVYSSAIKKQNVEIKEALKIKIPLISRAEMLAELMRMKKTITVAGSHGKTTTISIISEIFVKCNPKKTLFIVTSKSFSTIETLENAKLVAEWLSKHKVSLNDSMVAVTSLRKKALDWGFNDSNIFEISENVGGRYSLWSSVGMSIFIGLGEDNYKNFLLGARTMDEHFINEEVENNIPIILALLRIWNRNFLNRNNHCIVPYTDNLSKFPAWAQQLEMESNGKGVDINGATLKMPASPIIWGEVGTNAQHSFFQFLHQGLEVSPTDILVPRKPLSTICFKGSEKNHEYLLINAIAQAEALARGSVDLINQNKNFLGGRPSTIISWEENTPFSIGMLIALYENITIASGFLWNINSFDQWGVELGKTIACLLYTSPSPRDGLLSRMPSSP